MQLNSVKIISFWLLQYYNNNDNNNNNNKNNNHNNQQKKGICKIVGWPQNKTERMWKEG